MFDVTVYTTDGNVIHGTSAAKDCVWINGNDPVSAHYVIELITGRVTVPTNKLVAATVVEAKA